MQLNIQQCTRAAQRLAGRIISYRLLIADSPQIGFEARTACETYEKAFSELTGIARNRQTFDEALAFFNQQREASVSDPE